MSLNDIVNKLARYNYKRNLLFCISVMFSVAMLGAYGILQFSPTVTKVLIATGSTYVISLVMFALTISGMVIFLIYANSIYLKFKLEEVGIFQSLGLKRQAVITMMKREFHLLFGISMTIGLVSAIPIAYLFWTCLTVLIRTTETAFVIGWPGLVLAVIFALIMWGALLVLNSQTIRKMAIIKSLKISSQAEEVKFSSPILGIIGLLCIPLGFILFNLFGSASGNLSQLSFFFLLLSLIGLYLVTSEITSIGSIFKGLLVSIYLKNLLFFNLVKQKGRQYTLSLFVSTILIAITIFGLCFNGIAFIDGYFQNKNDPYDYTQLVSFQQEGLDESAIRELGDEYDVDIQRFVGLDLLLLGRQHRYDEGTVEWSGQYVTNESSYNQLTDSVIEVPVGSVVAFDEINTSFNSFYGEDILLFNPTLNKEFRLTLHQKIVGDTVINKSGSVTDFVILDDSDYGQLKATTDSKYQLGYYLFNAENSSNAADFQSALLNKVVETSDGLILDNLFDSPIRALMTSEVKEVEIEDEYLTYEGNELYAARWWDMYPFSRETAISTMIESGAIYLLLMFFIAIIAFTSALMIIGIKTIGTIEQDKESYQKAVFLGLKRKELNQLLSKQLALIYFYPTILGCTMGILMTIKS